MNDKELEQLARHIKEESRVDGLEVMVDSRNHYARIIRKDVEKFPLNVCVNLCYNEDGNLVIVNHKTEENSFYDRLNSSIASFISDSGLEVVFCNERRDGTAYYLKGDIQHLVPEEYELPKGQRSLKHLDFLEAECLMRGLHPGTTSHELGCMKYLVDQEITSESDLEFIKCGLDPKKASDEELFCAQYGLDPKTVTVNQVSESVKNAEPIVFELGRIYREKGEGELTEEDLIMARRRHFYNCDITDEQVRTVNHLFWEFPDNYSEIIPLEFKLMDAVREEDYEYAARIRDKIKQCTSAARGEF